MNEGSLEKYLAVGAGSNVTSYPRYETLGKINVFSGIDINDLGQRYRSKRKAFAKKLAEQTG